MWASRVRVVQGSRWETSLATCSTVDWCGFWLLWGQAEFASIGELLLCGAFAMVCWLFYVLGLLLKSRKGCCKSCPQKLSVTMWIKHIGMFISRHNTRKEKSQYEIPPIWHSLDSSWFTVCTKYRNGLAGQYHSNSFTRLKCSCPVQKWSPTVRNAQRFPKSHQL